MTSTAVIVIESCNVVLGILLNVLLIFLIINYSNPRLGNYKSLLKIFACYDIYMALLHAVVQPVSRLVFEIFTPQSFYASYSSGSALGVFSRTFPNEKYVTALCAACMTVALTLMNISFLHRYWSVRRTHRVSLFSNNKFLFLCSLYPITMAFLWYCSSISLADNTIGKSIVQRSISDGITVADGWLVIHFWEKDQLHVRGLITLLCGECIIGANLVIGGVLFCLTLHHLKAEYTFSDSYRTYQFKILRVLFAQSAIPMISVYIPAGLGVTLPLFITQERKGGMDIWFTLISSFPALDAVVIILLMRDFRDGLIGMFHRRYREQNVKTLQSA